MSYREPKRKKITVERKRIDALKRSMKGSLVKLFIVISSLVVSFVLLAWNRGFLEASSVIEFFIEIFGVGMGIVLGFYWHKIPEAADQLILNSKIIAKIIDELLFNQSFLRQIYSSGGTSYLRNLLRTKSYDFNRERLGPIQDELINELDDIYYYLNILNKNIKEYPMTNHFDANRSDLYIIQEMRTLVWNKTQDWIPKASKRFEIKIEE
ncbi:hypothetical protein ES703_75312 [subsurface metagenome]